MAKDAPLIGKRNIRFIVTLWVMLLLAFALTGERFLDWAFDMPDMGRVDDVLISSLFWVEDIRQDLQIEDVFGALRNWLHRMTGLS